ncbi:MAG: peroxide stress protein YaaA [Gammaproteobacteria bacterium]|nr:peroxide stress protein YaaA [Gammaproteobacteria bacterium]
MIIVISPAKTLDFESTMPTEMYSQPTQLEQSQLLINRLKDLSSLDLSELMHISTKIADLNFERNHAWQTPFTKDNARQALFAFKGDVYTGIDAYSMTDANIAFAQKHLRMLSGLYGLLKPLDLMQAYRLEMGSKLQNLRGKNLYEFWGDRITNIINEELKANNSDTLLNLASNEYFKAVKVKQVNADIITPQFKDYKNGDYKMIGFYAKKARGLMSRYIIDNQITNVDAIKDFDSEGYAFHPAFSEGNQWVFTRKQ